MNEMPVPDVLERLSAEIASRRAADGKTSYTASLFERGEDTILKKVGEEAVEFILAAKEDDPAHLIAEGTAAELEDGRKKAEADAEDAVMNKSEDQKTS